MAAARLAKILKTVFWICLGCAVLGTIDVAIQIASVVPQFDHLSDKTQYRIRLADGTSSTRWVGPKAPGWVPLSAMSREVPLAIIASEDRLFFKHQGVDWQQVFAIMCLSFEQRRVVGGASTITQQLIKNLFLEPQRRLDRKIAEMILAGELEKRISKQDILCYYCNMAEWGPGIYGIGEAAKYYYGISPADLDAKQSVVLARLLPAPRERCSYFANKKLPPATEQDVRNILIMMRMHNFIDHDQFNAALKEPVWPEAKSSNKERANGAPH